MLDSNINNIVNASDTNIGYIIQNSQVTINDNSISEDKRKYLVARAELAEEKYKLKYELIANFFATLYKSNIPEERWGEELRKVAIKYSELQLKISAMEVFDKKTEELKEIANKALSSQDLSEANRILEEYASYIKSYHQNHYIELANTCIIRAIISETFPNHDYEKSALLYHEAGMYVKDIERNLHIDCRFYEADAYLKHSGKENNIATEDAILIYKKLLKEFPRNIDPFTWAYIKNRVGIALKNRGESQTSKIYTEEAIISYKEALEIYTNNNDPDMWATVQNNLGNAIVSLCKGENKKLLNEAETAFKNALSIRESTNNLYELSVTQESLGNLYTTRGLWVSSEYYLALDYYKKSLNNRPKNNVDLLDWIRIRYNIGNVLNKLGRITNDIKYFLEAEAILIEALSEPLFRQISPLEWTTAKNNLGIALRALGEFEDNPKRFYDAIAEFHDLLKIITKDSYPLDWARTKLDLGNAYSSLSDKVHDKSILEKSIESYNEALEIYTKDKAYLSWGLTNNNLAAALTKISEYEPNTKSLEKAIELLKKLLNEIPYDDSPIDWAMRKTNLGSALKIFFERNIMPDNGNDIKVLFRIKDEAKKSLLEGADAFKRIGNQKQSDLVLDFAQSF
jgi:tetratricopeptide (TPR) repeat protein